METVSLDEISSADSPLTCLTCYDYLTARVMDEVPGLDIILVGDSLGMVELGHENTIPVTIDDMVHHTAAVSRAVEKTYLVSDLPFLEAADEKSEFIDGVGRLMQEGGAQAVKIEGGRRNLEYIELLAAHDVPVFGHLGLTPQSVEGFGGYKIQANTRAGIEKIGRDALALQEAGIVALVLECVPAAVATELTEFLEVPTIGIGAGQGCDGQVLVWQDMMGMTEDETPTFVRKWGEMREQLRDGVSSFCNAVKEKEFPADEESFSVDDSLNRSEIRSLLPEL